jgi:hypothetical protein
VEGGAVDEFLGVAVEGLGFDQFQVEFGCILEDPAKPALPGDYGEEGHLDSVDEAGGQEGSVQGQAAVGAQRDV